MKIKLEKIKAEVIQALGQVVGADQLEALEIKYLGRRGELNKIMKQIVDLSKTEKKAIGQLANQIKTDIIAEFEKHKGATDKKVVSEGALDVTLPGKKIESGHLHPITIVQKELSDLFTSMGFMILDGPELESDYYNFETLNIPKYHPARDMQDTFYIDHKNKEDEFDMVLRTHTSPMQVRAMQKYGAPLRCVVPGRVFRNEATDACHEHTLYQLEGLMIDKNISIANLIAVVKEMLSGIFKQEINIRVRPGYFPFVEPGIEFDMGCLVCHGKNVLVANIVVG